MQRDGGVNCVWQPLAKLGRWTCSRCSRESSQKKLYLDGPPPHRNCVADNRPCVKLGPPTGELVECQSCCGTVRIKLFACAVHGVCTAEKYVPVIACCGGERPCGDYAPAS